MEAQEPMVSEDVAALKEEESRVPETESVAKEGGAQEPATFHDPEVAALMKEIPDQVQKDLKELFRGEVTGVRIVKPEELL